MGVFITEYATMGMGGMNATMTFVSSIGFGTPMGAEIRKNNAKMNRQDYIRNVGYTGIENDCLRNEIAFDKKTAREVKEILGIGGGYLSARARKQIAEKLNRIIRSEYLPRYDTRGN